MIHYVTPGELTAKSADGFSSIEIKLPTSVADLGEITLTKRYPANGRVFNSKCTMIVRILKGSVLLHYDEEQALLLEGATVLIEMNKKYCWIPEGSVTLLVFSAPRWSSSQQRKVPE